MCPLDNYACRRLSDTIKYQTLALPKNLPMRIDLIRLVVVKNDNTQHRNSYFSIKDREEAENVSIANKTCIVIFLHVYFFVYIYLKTNLITLWRLNPKGIPKPLEVFQFLTRTGWDT